MKKNSVHDFPCGSAVSSAEMKEIERRADEAGLSYYQMMENAGTGAAEYILSRESVAGKTVLVCCGKGNNGGDGFVTARKLTEAGATVRLILAEGEPKTEDAVKNRQICRTMSLTQIEPGGMSDIETITEQADLIIDAIYGTGFHGKLRDPVRQLARMINRAKAAVYALDIPSGLNGNTGEADEDTIRADCTIVFHLPKPAHMMENHSLYCGETVCISIGIEKVLK